jgi:hypothetical protein
VAWPPYAVLLPDLMSPMPRQRTADVLGVSDLLYVHRMSETLLHNVIFNVLLVSDALESVGQTTSHFH